MTHRRLGWAFALAAAVLAAAPADAQQGPLEARYLAERDAAIKQFDKPKIDEPLMAAERKAREALEKQMLAIVGPVEIAGYGAPKINLDTLFKGDLGFGLLDGVLLKTADDRAKIIVTTQTLFERWLAGRREAWWPKRTSFDKAVAAAFADDQFFTQATWVDAALVRYANVPLSGAPKLSIALAGGRTQDAMPNAADEYHVAAVQGGRMFLAYGKIDPALAVSACDAERKAAEEKATALYEKFQFGGSTDKALANQAGSVRGRSEKDYLTCMTTRMPKTPGFAAATAAIQAVYDALPKR